MSIDNENQTTFSQEKPLFEEPPVFKSTAPEVELDPEQLAVVQAKQRQKKIIIGVAVGSTILVLLLLILAMFMSRRQVPISQILTPSSPTPQPINDPLDQKIQTLKQQLQEADPTKRDYPFPPVDMAIRLDPKVNQ